MDHRNFDDLARSLTTLTATPSRRTFTRMLATSSLAAALGSHIHLAEARKKGGKKGGKHGGKHGGKNNHESPATLPGGPTTPPPGGGSCNPGLTLCGAACIDTNANVAHCGGCGHACQSGQTCQNGGCVSNQSCKTKVERKSEFLDPERYIETTATSYCDGFLRVVTFARNAHWDAGFKPRIQIMAFDAEDKTWLSPVFAFPISLCSTLDPSLGCKTEREYSFSDVRIPEDFAKRVVRLEIFHAHDRNPV